MRCVLSGSECAPLSFISSFHQAKQLRLLQAWHKLVLICLSPGASCQGQTTGGGGGYVLINGGLMTFF